MVNMRVIMRPHMHCTESNWRNTPQERVKARLHNFLYTKTPFNVNIEMSLYIKGKWGIAEGHYNKL
jgi:hypothetical protein